MNGARFLLAFLLAPSAALLAQDPKPAPPPARPAVGGQDEDPTARTVRETQDEQLRRERKVVTIRIKNGTIKEVVDEFRKQTPWNIVVDMRNIPEDYRVDELQMVDEPARKALEEFAHKAELTVEDVTPTMIRLSRPPRLTFNFRDADIKVVIDMIARVSGANVIIAPEVKGTITLSINNVPWTNVLEAVVKTLGFTTVKESFDIIRIIHPDELMKQMETQVFRLRYIQPPSSYTAKVEENKQISGRPMVPPQQIEELLKRFTLKQVLDTVLSKDSTGRQLGRLDFDPQSLSLVVTDTKVVLARIKEIIDLLDVEPEQVIIDVKFISTTNEDLLTFGVNWSLGDQGGLTINSRILDPSNYPTGLIPPPSGGPSGGKITQLPFGFGREIGSPGSQFFLTEYDMSMTFRAFKQDRFSRLIQEPTLAVLDNSEATIFVGETISYAEARSTQNSFGGIDFTLGEAGKSPVKVGFQLFVIPKIVRETNRVILTIIPQNEFLSGSSGVAAVPGFERFTLVSGGGAQSIDLPRISSTTMVTRLILESNRTAVLGGLVVERSTMEDRGIPVLKDLPLINYLFKQRNDTMRKENLLVFITPRIVRAGNEPKENLDKLLKLREDVERRSFEEKKKAEQEKK